MDSEKRNRLIKLINLQRYTEAEKEFREAKREAQIWLRGELKFIFNNQRAINEQR